VHGIGGLWGTVAAGIWASKAVNAAGADGLLNGNPGQAWIQAKAGVLTAVYSFVVSWLLLKAVDATIGLRASEDEERIGLDLTQHREAGYTGID
jgi:Amt family ammonium transporter